MFPVRTTANACQIVLPIGYTIGSAKSCIIRLNIFFFFSLISPLPAHDVLIRFFPQSYRAERARLLQQTRAMARQKEEAYQQDVKRKLDDDWSFKQQKRMQERQDRIRCVCARVSVSQSESGSGRVREWACVCANLRQLF